MKKLKKQDFKKLALMGMAGGALLASEVSAGQGQGPSDNNGRSTTVAMSCSSCSAGKGLQAYRDAPNSQQQYYNQMASCSNMNPPQGQGYPQAYRQQNNTYTQWETTDSSNQGYQGASCGASQTAPNGQYNQVQPNGQNNQMQPKNGQAPQNPNMKPNTQAPNGNQVPAPVQNPTSYNQKWNSSK